MFFKCNLSNIYYMTQLYEIKVGLSPNQKKISVGLIIKEKQ